MIALTDHAATDRPTQTVIARLLAEGLPATLTSKSEAIIRFPDHVIRITGDRLKVSDGEFKGGTITGIQLSNSLFSPLTPLDDGVAPFVYDPRIGTIEGLDLSARDFTALIDAAQEGRLGPLKNALTDGGITYRDDYFDNAAKGGRGDDLFLDLAGSDNYNGGRGIDTLSYEFSLPGDTDDKPFGISADLATGKILTVELPPILPLAGGAGVDTTSSFTLLDDWIYTPLYTFETDTVTGIENLTGTRHDDVIKGDEAANTLRGLDGDDLIRGRQGDDVIDGGDGDDRLNGNRGDDTIRSGDGTDFIKGGLGADTFVFDLSEDGRNVIRDFNPEEDEIELSLLGFDLSITQRGDDVVIRHTDDQPWIPVPEEELSSITIVLRDTHLDDLMMGDNLSIFYAQY